MNHSFEFVEFRHILHDYDAILILKKSCFLTNPIELYFEKSKHEYRIS